MNKITADQLSSYEFKTCRAAYSSKVEDYFRAMSGLTKGEGLLIKKEEWPLKNPPYAGNMPKRLRILSHAKYRTRTLADETGWVVVREE